MPSTLLGQPLNSGGQPIWSGNPYSGANLVLGGLQLRLHPNASGNVYIFLSGAYVHPGSGGPTLLSGGLFLSGTSGLMDGMILAPGDSYFIPAGWIREASKSGINQVCALHDAAASGQARLFWEFV